MTMMVMAIIMSASTGFGSCYCFCYRCCYFFRLCSLHVDRRTVVSLTQWPSRNRLPFTAVTDSEWSKM